MEYATVREVQHRLSAYLKIVSCGGEVQIMNRKHPVAKLVPVEVHDASQQVDWSSHQAEIRRIFKGRKVKGKSLSKIIAESRGDF